MEKAIEIKRRAQRFVQSGDVEAALAEYEKLARAEENEPYHSVVIADLLVKKGDSAAAASRYLSAVDGYEQSGLYKNGIAVCKKMARLGLATGKVFKRLGQLHALDGLATESGLYFLQHAEFAARAGDDAEAALSLRLAFDASNENVIALERLAEIHVLNGEDESAIAVMKEAIAAYDHGGQLADARRCEARLRQVNPAAADSLKAESAASSAPAPLATHEAAAARGITKAHEAAPTVPDVVPAAVTEDAIAPPLVLTRPQDDLSPDQDEEQPVTTVRFEPPAHVETIERESVSAHLGGREEDTLKSAVPVAPVTPPRDANGVNAARAAKFGLASLAESLAESLADVAPQRPGLSFGASSANGGAEIGVENRSAVTSDAGPSANADASASRIPEDSVSGPALKPQPGEELFHALLPDAADDDALLELLQQAVDSHRSGAPEAVAQLLVRVAQAHEAMGNASAAAGVYRALAAHLPPVRPAMMLWFDNCRRRGDRAEGARVACDLGDEALKRGDALAAREWFERSHALDPHYETAVERVVELGLRTSAPARAATAVVTEPVVEGRPARVAAPEAPVATTVDPLRIQVTHGFGDHVTMDLHELVATFQTAVQGQVSGDAESHYALGVSYMEMGLAQQAIESLRAAAEQPSLRARAFELIGRCCMDQGRFDDATVEYRAALAQHGLAPDAELNVRFELGIALEAAGKHDEALVEFETIYAAQSSYPDVALKIRALRKSLEME